MGEEREGIDFITGPDPDPDPDPDTDPDPDPDPDPGPDPGPRFLLDSIVDPVPVFKEVFKPFCTLRFLSSSSLSEESGVRCRDWDLPPPNNGDFVPKDVPELILPALRKGSVATLKIERTD